MANGLNEPVSTKDSVFEYLKTMNKQLPKHTYMLTTNLKITLKTLEAHHIVNLEDIIYCKSSGNYTTFHLSKEKIMVCKPLKHVESLLNEKLFLRCHQSYMVNTSYVTKYTNEGQLILKNGVELPVAIRRKDIVLKRLF